MCICVSIHTQLLTFRRGFSKRFSKVFLTLLSSLNCSARYLTFGWIYTTDARRVFFTPETAMFASKSISLLENSHIAKQPDTTEKATSSGKKGRQSSFQL